MPLSPPVIRPVITPHRMIPVYHDRGTMDHDRRTMHHNRGMVNDHRARVMNDNRGTHKTGRRWWRRGINHGPRSVHHNHFVATGDRNHSHKH